MTAPVTVITGASAGIGAALARTLAAEGHALVLAARRRPELEAVGAECRTAGSPVVLTIACDVTKRAEVDALAASAIAHFGHFDTWVNNAGRGITRDVLELTDDDLDQMWTINVKSAVYGMQAACAHFVPRGSGHVINVSSVLGRIPLASFRSAYSACKAALNSLTTNLRMDMRAKHPGVHVSLVMPGVVLTDFAKNVVGTPRPPMRGGAALGATVTQPQTADEVAAVLAQVIAAPSLETFTNPGSPAQALEYATDLAGFEARLVDAIRA
jgi:short-subunit dehydrogenase